LSDENTKANNGNGTGRRKRKHNTQNVCRIWIDIILIVKFLVIYEAADDHRLNLDHFKFDSPFLQLKIRVLQHSSKCANTIPVQSRALTYQIKLCSNNYNLHFTDVLAKLSSTVTERNYHCLTKNSN
jgi:hypothetical protein